MAFLGTNSLDDYKNDIKPDQTMPNYNDSLSSCAWASTQLPNYFATTSWDGELKVLSIEQGQFGPAIFQKVSYKFPSPALKCTWNDQNTHIYVGLLDGSVKVYDLGSGQVADLGRHTAGISSLHFVQGMNAIISTAYESQVHIWQPGTPNPVASFNADNKVFCSDFKFPTLVAGTANEKLMLVQINNPNSRVVVDSTDLGKFSQIQSIGINSKGTAFGAASFDGRANLSNIGKNVNGQFAPKAIITFKSNKQEESGNTILYPINSVAFNPLNQRWFMTAGSDGVVHFWDYEARNKIKTLNYGGQPLCTATVNPKGDMLAYGLGNDWHLGQEGVGKWQPKVGVHVITQAQTRFSK